MGLSVEVGKLAALNSDNDPEAVAYYQRCVDHINETIDEMSDYIDMPEQHHHEPLNLPLDELVNRSHTTSFPYSYLHYLRRLYYLSKINNSDSKPSPVPEGIDPNSDIDEEAIIEMSMSSHLLGHSDCEGFYLPLDFEDPITNFYNPEKIVGGLVGSSIGLQRELIEIAPLLNIHLSGNQLSDSEAERLNQDVIHESDFYIEKLVWLTLFDATRLSIKYNTMIYFN